MLKKSNDIYDEKEKSYQSGEMKFFLKNIEHISILFIPKGTVDNNLGPDLLAGSKALYPNRYRQPTI